MTEFQPWVIQNGTLQLNPWPEHTGRVVVTVDVFEPLFPRMPVNSEKLVRDEGDEPWHPRKWHRNGNLIDAGDIYCGGCGGERLATVADCLQTLFRHIDANPQATYHLRTLHPERVREAWPRVAVNQCSDCGSRYVGVRLPEGFKCAECEAVVSTLHRPNVAIAAGPIRTQAEADRLLPELLQLSDLCREVYPWCRPVERIQLWKWVEPLQTLYSCQKCGEGFSDGEADRHGRHPYCGGEGDAYDEIGGSQFPRIVVSGGPEPMYPDHVRDLRGQAEAAGVQFVFMGWGDWLHMMQFGCGEHDLRGVELRGPINAFMARVGSENSGCELDDKTYPWESEVKA